MVKLSADPKIRKLARDLGLPPRTNPVEAIREYALQMIHERLLVFPDVASLTGLRALLCDYLSVCLELVRTDDDLVRVAQEYRFPKALYSRLVFEFDQQDVEGWLIYNPAWRPGLRQYVAIVDARGARVNRSYFTGWHEIVHMIVTPTQLAIEGFRRSIPVDKSKDSVESIVDIVAGELAFYAPFVVPTLLQEMAPLGRLTFEVIDNLKQQVAPEASFYSAALAAVRLCPHPVLLVQVQPALKKAERLSIANGQCDFGLVAPKLVVPKLRAVHAIPGGVGSGLKIFRNMRIPADSVLSHAHETQFDVELRQIEDQAWWEERENRPLPARAIHVEAVRRGSYVYGLISPLTE